MEYVALITAGLDGIQQIVTLVEKWKAAAAQTSALTPAEDAALTARMQTMFSSPAWQPDAPK